MTQEQIQIVVAVIAALALVSGGLKYYLDRQRAGRERYDELLKDFLEPLKGTLRETDDIHKQLTGVVELQQIEFDPRELKRLYGSLPNSQPLKISWKNRIQRLQDLNGKAVELIDRFYGHIMLDEFQSACDDYKRHVHEWEDVWNAVMGSEDIPETPDAQGALMAPMFPDHFDQALEAELSEVSRRAH